MAGTTELENLIVRLTGDGEQYAKMLEQAMKNTEVTTKHLEEAVHKIEGFGEAIEGFAGKAVAALKATAEFEFLKGTFEAFSGREQVMIRLSAALETNGRAVQATTADYKKFAKETQEVSLSSSGEVLKLLAKAEAYEITGESAKKAVQSALAIAAVNETEANSVLRVTAAIEKGNIDQAMAMARLIPELRGVKDEEEFLEKVQKLTEIGMKTLEHQAHSSEGTVHHLGIAWKQFKADLGEFVAEGVKPVIEGLTGFINLLRALPVVVQELLVAIIAISAAMTTLGLIMPIVTAAFGASYAALIVFSTALLANPLTAWIVVIGAAVAALIFLGQTAHNELSAVKDFNMELEISAKLRKDLLSKQEVATQKIVTEASHKGAREDKSHFLAEQMAKAEKESQGYERELRRINKEMDAIEQNILVSNQEWEAMNQELVQTQDLLEGNRKRVTTLKAEMEKVSQKELLKEIDEARDKLIEQKNLLGKSADEAERFKLVQAGASKKQLGEFDEAAAALNKKKAYLELQEQVDKLSLSLMEQIGTFGMDANEIDLYRLASEGASAAQLSLSKALQEQLKALEDQQEAMDAGAELIDKFQTPTDKFFDTQNQLNSLLRKGAIDVGTYERAMRQARKELEGAAAAQKDFAGAGSAEALARINQYKEANFSKADITGKTFTPAAGSPNAATIGSADAVNRLDKTNTILQQIKDALKIQTDPGVTLSPARLEL